MNLKFNRPAPLAALAALALLAGCKPDLESSPKASAGDADFARYIAVGNSLTAGFADNGLYREGQLSSYPSILAQQFRAVGGGEFRQPLFTEAQANGSGYLVLTGFTAPTPTAPSAPITGGVAPQAVRGFFTPALVQIPVAPGVTVPYQGPPRPLLTKYLDPIENLGVPGIRLSDILTPGYGSQAGNPYFERITPDGTPFQTYLQRIGAEAQSATFFSCWLGNNDILGFATAGAAANPPTPADTFRLKYNRALNVLTARGAKGVVATIPDVTGIPFFTTVGPGFRARLATPQPGLPNGVPGIVILTGANPGGPTSANRRQIATADIRLTPGNGRQLFTLTSSAFLGLIGRPTSAPWRYIFSQANQPQVLFGPFLNAFGIDTTAAFGVSAGNPIPSAFVLDDVEQTTVINVTNQYNADITAAGNARGLAVFDANGYFRNIAANGAVANGVANGAGFISGNLFGLDGVHPTPRGYALIANEMIRAINVRYNASVSGVDATTYRGVKFP